MAARSAGIVLYRGVEATLEVLLVHPGGPLWARRDRGAWSIPKGEYPAYEDPLSAARREFAEELGTAPPEGRLLDLGEVRQRSGKLVRAWALRGDLDANSIKSNSFTLEWPPHSGRIGEYPEVDRAQWFALPAALERIVSAQAPLLTRLEHELSDLGGEPRAGRK